MRLRDKNRLDKTHGHPIYLSDRDYGYKLKHLYGITLEQYNEMLADQLWGCAICGKSTSGKHLDVDHDHKTGRVRSLLCRRCNILAGLLDNGLILSKVQDYIKSFSK